MSTRFVACPACSRHVRAGDAVCPFCGAAAPTPAPRRLLGGRLSRAALGAAGAVGATVALADCSSGNVSQTAFYGAASCGDAGTCQIADSGTDMGDVATGVFYGIACPDGSCFPQMDAGSDAGPSADAQADGAAGDASTDGGGD